MSNKYFPGNTRAESATAADAFCEYMTSKTHDGCDYGLTWKMDCGFKVDADGPLVAFESRFYPDDTLNGTARMYVGDVVVFEHKVFAETTQELGDKVIDLYLTWRLTLLSMIRRNISELISATKNTRLGVRSEDDEDVHTRHCCAEHGCKYQDENCTVVTGQKKQAHPCPMCTGEDV